MEWEGLGENSAEREKVRLGLKNRCKDRHRERQRAGLRERD